MTVTEESGQAVNWTVDLGNMTAEQHVEAIKTLSLEAPE